MQFKRIALVISVLLLVTIMPYLPVFEMKLSEHTRFEDVDRDESFPEVDESGSGMDDPDWNRDSDKDGLSDGEEKDWLDPEDFPGWMENLIKWETGDLDGDGIPNNMDEDMDGDGIPDGADPNPVHRDDLIGDRIPIDNFYNALDREELNRIVFRVSPADDPRYWRATTYDTYVPSGYSSGLWTKSSTKLYDTGNDGGVSYADAPVKFASSRDLTYTIVFQNDSGDDTYIPTALYTKRVNGAVYVDEAGVIRHDGRGGFHTSEALKSYSFTTTEYAYLAGQMRSAVLPPVTDTYKNYREYPRDLYNTPGNLEHRVVELANNITANISSPYEQALAIATYLREKYYFNMKARPAARGYDGVDYFLFVSKQGKCTNFASAFIMLARIKGIPSRLAVGFALGELDGTGSRVVKLNHAHAWPEVYLKDVGWIPFEPTSSRIVQDGETGANSQGSDPTVQNGGDGGGSTEGDEADTDGDGLPDHFENIIGTDPFNNDTDGDLIPDGPELYGYDTDPLSRDTDGDGLSDHLEITGWTIRIDPVPGGLNITKHVFSDPLLVDTEGDGLNDSREYFHGTDPDDIDTDMEGVSDLDEVTGWDVVVNTSHGKEHLRAGSDPTIRDTDSDGVLDDDEFKLGSNATDPDTDGGGAPDGIEFINENNLLDPSDDSQFMDSDRDGLTDWEEMEGWDVNITGREGYHVDSSPFDSDSDDDGLNDWWEFFLGIDPRLQDTDTDGLTDHYEYYGEDIVVTVAGEEIVHHNTSDPLNNDTDADGLTDDVEFNLDNGHRTDPRRNDTDQDGILDPDDPFPTIRAYRDVEISIEIIDYETDVQKGDTLHVHGRVTSSNGTALPDVGLELLVEENRASRRIGRSGTNETGEFSFAADVMSVQPGAALFRVRSLESYSREEVYRSNTSGSFTVDIYSASRITHNMPSTVGKSKHLEFDVNILDLGNLGIVNGTLRVEWNGSEIFNSLSDTGRFHIDHEVVYPEGDHVLRFIFPGNDHVFPGSITTGIKVLTDRIWLNISVPSRSDVDGEFQIHGNITGMVSGENTPPTGESVGAYLGYPDGISNLICEGTIEGDGSFLLQCTLDPSTARAGPCEIYVAYPGNISLLYPVMKEHSTMELRGFSYISLQEKQVFRGRNFSVSGRLVGNTGENLSGMAVDIRLDGVHAGSAVTSRNGIFSLMLFTKEDESLGPHGVTASFNGTVGVPDAPEYYGTAASTIYQVTARTNLSMEDVMGFRGGEAVITGRLSIDHDEMHGDRVIRLFRNGLFEGTTRTGPDGTFSFVLSLDENEPLGSSWLLAIFEAEGYYGYSSAEAQLLVRTNISITVEEREVFRHAPGNSGNEVASTVEIAGRLEGVELSADGNGLPVSIHWDGKLLVELETDTSGAFSYNYTLDYDQSYGDIAVRAEFYGAREYAPAWEEAAFKVMANTSVVIEEVIDTVRGQYVTVSGTLRDDLGEPVLAGNVELSLNNSILGTIHLTDLHHSGDLNDSMNDPPDTAVVINALIPHSIMHGENSLALAFDGTEHLSPSRDEHGIVVYAPTVLGITASREVPRGGGMEVVVTLTDENGSPLFNRVVEILVDGEVEKTRRTDENGRFYAYLPYPSDAGDSVTVSARYSGGKDTLPSSSKEIIVKEKKVEKFPWAVAGISVVVLIVGALLGMRWFRESTPTPGEVLQEGSHRLDRGEDYRETVKWMFSSMRDSLVDHDYLVPGHLTAREFNKALRSALFVDREQVNALTDLFEQARYSPHEPLPGVVEEHRTLLNEILLDMEAGFVPLRRPGKKSERIFEMIDRIREKIWGKSA